MYAAYTPRSTLFQVRLFVLLSFCFVLFCFVWFGFCFVLCRDALILCSCLKSPMGSRTMSMVVHGDCRLHVCWRRWLIGVFGTVSLLVGIAYFTQISRIPLSLPLPLHLSLPLIYLSRFSIFIAYPLVGPRWGLTDLLVAHNEIYAHPHVSSSDLSALFVRLLFPPVWFPPLTVHWFFVIRRCRWVPRWLPTATATATASLSMRITNYFMDLFVRCPSLAR